MWLEQTFPLASVYDTYNNEILRNHSMVFVYLIIIVLETRFIFQVHRYSTQVNEKILWELP